VSGKPGYWRAPRDHAQLLGHGLTATEFALVMYVGLVDGELEDGVSVTLDFLATHLGCATKTISRALTKLSALDLLRHDLRQGQRTPFLLRLGAAALYSPTSDTTSDTNPRREVRSHIGQADADRRPPGESRSANAAHPTSDSRARASETETQTESVTEEAKDEPGLATPHNGRPTDDVAAYVQRARRQPDRPQEPAT
jgi:hypothetical protein